MTSSDELNTIIERIASGTQTATDVEALRVALSDHNQDLLQPSITHQVDAVRLISISQNNATNSEEAVVEQE